MTLLRVSMMLTIIMKKKVERNIFNEEFCLMCHIECTIIPYSASIFIILWKKFFVDCSVPHILQYIFITSGAVYNLIFISHTSKNVTSYRVVFVPLPWSWWKNFCVYNKEILTCDYALCPKNFSIFCYICFPSINSDLNPRSLFLAASYSKDFLYRALSKLIIISWFSVFLPSFSTFAI